MDTSLRYEIERAEPVIDTVFDFSDSQGILRATEKCNGSGDCRKSVSAGGTMCPSYRGTKNEKDTTRARANTLREFLTNSEKSNKYNHKELKEVFDLCLSCKACASECPSNVDIAVLKSEFLYQYQKDNKPTFRDRLFAFNAKYNRIGSRFPHITNFILRQPIAKKILGISIHRTIPPLSNQTFKNWIQKNNSSIKSTKSTICVYCVLVLFVLTLLYSLFAVSVSNTDLFCFCCFLSFSPSYFYFYCSINPSANAQN